MSRLTISAHAKLNLFLRVLAREDDGYHGIETLFALIDLADTVVLEQRPGNGVTLTAEGADCGPPAQNLATRAAEMVLDAVGQPFAVHIAITKRIPVQAGLGGGSADAAAALLGVNQLAGNAIPRHELLQFAGRLGSDIPFLLSGAPLALGWGHGERLLRLPPLPPAPGLLLIPSIGVSTADAYRQVDGARQGIGRRGAVTLDLDAVASWGSIARLAGNDFEFALFGRHQELKRGFEALAATHPLLCRMTGSGSALFAIYRNPKERDEARIQLNPRMGRVVEFKCGGEG
jgi:4-diphosphocytidyl-2-C-methyl-D-erythritol kinase